MAGRRSRFGTPEFYAVFASPLRTLRLFQTTKGAMERHGFEEDMKLIASITSNYIVESACHESAPCTNESLAQAGNEKVRVALQHFTFSTATVPLTDGNNMRLTHFGDAMQRIFGPLTVFSTNNYADNYSPRNR